jgi:hypothetical protein
MGFITNIGSRRGCFLSPKISAPLFWEEEGRRSGVGGYLGGKEVYVGTKSPLELYCSIREKLRNQHATIA